MESTNTMEEHVDNTMEEHVDESNTMEEHVDTMEEHVDERSRSQGGSQDLIEYFLL